MTIFSSWNSELELHTVPDMIDKETAVKAIFLKIAAENDMSFETVCFNSDNSFKDIYAVSGTTCDEIITVGTLPEPNIYNIDDIIKYINQAKTIANETEYSYDEGNMDEFTNMIEALK